MDIRLGRYDEKCNEEESLFSTPAAVTPGCWGSERAFICSSPLMYSTGKDTLSNVKAMGSACIAFFAYVRSSPDCSVLGQCSSKRSAFTVLTTLNIHMENKHETCHQ